MTNAIHDAWHFMTTKVLAILIPAGTTGAGVITFLDVLNPLLSTLAMLVGIYGSLMVALHYREKTLREREDREHLRVERAKDK